MFERLLKKIAIQLKKGAIPYMVIGGQAVLLYGEPRLTRDIDITLGIGVEELGKVKKILRTMGLRILVKDDKEFVAKTMVLPAMERESGIRIDFTFSYSLYERQAIERAKEIKLGRTSVRFASLEDLVIHKVIAGRARDLEDVRSILLKNPKYDSHYIEKWLAEFDPFGGAKPRLLRRSKEAPLRVNPERARVLSQWSRRVDKSLGEHFLKVFKGIEKEVH